MRHKNEIFDLVLCCVSHESNYYVYTIASCEHRFKFLNIILSHVMHVS